MPRLNRVATLLLQLALALALAGNVGVGDLRAQALAEAPGSVRHSAAIEAGRGIIEQVMEENSIPGMSVAVGVDGAIVWSEGFGYADLEHRTPATTLTRFRIGSVSKPVTSAAIGKLYEEGDLDLDAPVQQYVPGFPEKRWPVTTRQLGGHLAGIRHYRGDEMLNSHRYETVEEGLTIFAADSLLHEPGSAYEYSSYGWNLISAVVEGASGDEFLPYMRREVFLPLGLRSIVAEHTDSIIAHRASFYELSDDGEVLNAPYVDNSYKWAGGGFISNTEDLVRFAYGMLDGTLLEPATVHLLFTSQRTTAGELTNYGIGWRSGVDEAGRRWVGHTGGSVGGRAVLVIYPDQEIVVAALANLGSAPMSPELAAEVAEGFVK
ncbi:MAG TPA: serine hydrolase domain-containing protein [Longimicrobiaceae bacterium]|nr:serine hydrolase domain-containing protein [Longimicrobiaceae bacterium]